MQEERPAQNKPTPFRLEDKDWSEVALLLNVHAKNYSASVQKVVREMAPKARVYVTHSIEEARAAVEDMIDNKVKVVFSGGGDGTLVGLIGMLRSRVQREVDIKLPTLGVLRLGTGNGWAYAAGISKKLGLIRSLLQHKEIGIKEFSLIEHEQTVFPFGGLGWDGGIINDYNDYKDRVRGTFMGRWSEGLWAYLATIISRTIPREMGSSRPEVRVEAFGKAEVIVETTSGPVAIPVDTSSGPIYEGPVSLCGGGTIPYYGYRFKAFPHIDAMQRAAHDRFEFRVYEGGPLRTLFHAGSIWRGTHRAPNFVSFLCSEVKMTFSRPMPMQLAGDACGYHSEVTFGMADYQVPMLVRS